MVKVGKCYTVCHVKWRCVLTGLKGFLEGVYYYVVGGPLLSG